jgi:predicted homoserine dehydrogenase-like protein
VVAALRAVDTGNSLGLLRTDPGAGKDRWPESEDVQFFLDGSKPAIESTAVCNATGLTPAPYGLLFPPASVDDIPNVMRPIAEGGHLHHKGQVEVISSLETDGRVIPYDIRFGVFVVFEGETEYIRNCFKHGAHHSSGRYARCMRWHLIGLNCISVASVGCAASRPVA